MRRIGRSRFFVIASIVGLSFTTAGSSFAASGKVVNDPHDGISFTLPALWSPIPLSGSDISYFLNEAAKNNASVRAALTKQVKQETKVGVKIFAVGPNSGSFFSNINVIVTSSKGYPKGKAFLNVAHAQVGVELTGAGFQNLKLTNATLPFGSALKATYSLSIKGHAMSVQGLQLYIRHGAHIYIVTITAKTQALDSSVLTTIGSSWRWT